MTNRQKDCIASFIITSAKKVEVVIPVLPTASLTETM